MDFGSTFPKLNSQTFDPSGILPSSILSSLEFQKVDNSWNRATLFKFISFSSENEIISFLFLGIFSHPIPSKILIPNASL